MASSSFTDWVSHIKGRAPHAPGSSFLERLPTELLVKILRCVSTASTGPEWIHALPENPTDAKPTGLLSSLLVSRRIHRLALHLLYRNPNLRAFRSPSTGSFFDAVERRPELGSFVYKLDIAGMHHCRCVLSHQALAGLPRLRDLRLALGQLPDFHMLRKLLLELPNLAVLAIDGRHRSDASPMLRGAFGTVPAEHSSGLTDVRFTGFTGADGIYIGGVLTSIIPRMRKLRLLDVSRSCFTTSALFSIAETARLTHLNIGGCRDLPALDALVAFLTTHPSVTSSLHTLDAGCITDSGREPLSETQVGAFLSRAPRTLKRLDLSMSHMGRSNLSPLRKLCRQLEALSVGSGLELRGIESVLLEPAHSYAEDGPRPTSTSPPTTERGNPAVLEAMGHAVAVCKLRRRLDSVTAVSGAVEGRSTLRYLNLSSIAVAEQGRLKQSVLLGTQTSPLSMIGVAGMAWDDLQVLERSCRAVGWKAGRDRERVWVERGGRHREFL